MNTIEQAKALCDQLGITDERSRDAFVDGYLRGSHDQLVKEIEREKETVKALLGAIPKKSFPGAETR